MQDLQEASSALLKALMIREKYMAMAVQTFPRTTARFLQTMDNKQNLPVLSEVPGEDRKTIEGKQPKTPNQNIQNSDPK